MGGPPRSEAKPARDIELRLLGGERTKLHSMSCAYLVSSNGNESNHQNEEKRSRLDYGRNHFVWRVLRVQNATTIITTVSCKGREISRFQCELANITAATGTLRDPSELVSSPSRRLYRLSETLEHKRRVR